MSIVLCGMGGSGKDTVKRLLLDKGFNSIVNFTSRPMREGERDGREYHFVDNDYFEEYANEFLEVRTYKETWNYGSKLNGYQSANGVGILTPSGARILKKKVPDAFIVYLHVSRPTAMMRMIKRGDNIDEVYRRNVSDIGMFEGFEEDADTVVDADFLTPPVVASLIEQRYERWERGLI